MKLILTDKGCTKNSTSILEVLMLFLYYNKADFESITQDLINKGYLSAAHTSNIPEYPYWITYKGTCLVNDAISDSLESDRSEEELLDLSEKLKEVFPKGKKDGTSNYWAEGKALIVKRLKVFFKKYGSDYTDEQIIEAAKKYIEGFNGDYRFMRTLKYFIYKDSIVAGEREYTSDLLNYLENAGQENTLKDDWNTELK